MLLMLDGVQGVGKSTLIRSLLKNNTYLKGYPVKLLKRTKELDNLLLTAPKILYDLKPDSYRTLINSILAQWKYVLRKASYERDTIHILDRGPITTLSYQALVLDYITNSEERYQAFAATYTGDPVPSRRRIESLFGSVQSMLYDFFTEEFIDLGLARQDYVMGIHIKSEASIISQRFSDRVEDVRPHNMQDWFNNKADEIDTYDMAYRMVNNWISDPSLREKFSLHCYNNSSTVEEGVVDIIKIVDRAF